ncbi:MAG TPA: ABC transporter permease [Terriglobia bacterium]|nr:ABC transporter permease [Terriglobia bacterium]
MTWLRQFVSRFVALFRKGRLEQEINDELRAHLEMLIEENVRRGMTLEEARYAAMRSFGGVEQVKESYREQRGLPIMETLLQDIRFGLRQLRRNPGFTAVAVLTLALGIGANTAIFSLVNGILVNPLPYAEPERLVSAWEATVPPGILEALRRQGHTMDLAAYTLVSGFNLNGETPLRLDGSTVSANLFSMLGVRPELGRIFRSGEDQPGQDNVVILSHSFWQNHFGGSPGVIGHSIKLDGINREIVGVMPSSFQLPSDSTELWVPMHIDPSSIGPYWGLWNYQLIGRLQPGVSVAQAEAEVQVLRPQIRKLFPWQMPDDWGLGNHIEPWQQQMVGDIHMKLLLLLGAVALILLLACANVANLLLSRAGVRQREVAVRAALGAGHRRIMRQLMTESLLLGISGGVLGLIFAVAGLSGLKLLLPADTPRLAAVGIDARVLGFTALASVLTGLIFGLAPALRAAKMDLEQSLKGNTVRAGRGVGRRRLSSILVVGEIALAMMLVVAAGLLVRTLWRLSTIDTGFEGSRVLTARVTPNSTWCQGETLPRCQNFYRQVLDRLRALPAVQDAAAVDSVPLGGHIYPQPLDIEGHLLPPGDERMQAWQFAITPGYFHTLGIPVLRGRAFNDSDYGSRPGLYELGSSVVIVSVTTARRFWPGEDPVGKRLKISWQKPWRTVVGVVGDVREYSLAPKWAGSTMGDIYFPYFAGVESTARDMTLVVRTRGLPEQVARDVRAVVAGVNPDVPLSEVRTMDGVLSASISAPRSIMWLFAGFALLALVLGTVGIYGVLSFSVAERTHEIGIRMALGAGRSNVMKLVLGKGLLLSLMGVATGIAGALAVTRFMTSLLYGVQPTDPLTFIVVSLLLVAVGLLASYIPARRATKVDPMVALRYE